MLAPTRPQERIAAATMAVAVMVLSLATAVLFSTELGGWILFLGTLAVIAFHRAEQLAHQPTAAPALGPRDCDVHSLDC